MAKEARPTPDLHEALAALRQASLAQQRAMAVVERLLARRDGSGTEIEPAIEPMVSPVPRPARWIPLKEAAARKGMTDRGMLKRARREGIARQDGSRWYVENGG